MSMHVVRILYQFQHTVIVYSSFEGVCVTTVILAPSVTCQLHGALFRQMTPAGDPKQGKIGPSPSKNRAIPLEK